MLLLTVVVVDRLLMCSCWQAATGRLLLAGCYWQAFKT